jgi:hypothetical protein
MYLVRGAITILKNDGVRQWGLDDIPYMKWKIPKMFETTNQLMYVYKFVTCLYSSSIARAAGFFQK